jgi:chitin synthase
MPIYNEDPHVLVRAIESIVELIYPSRALAVYLSFDCDDQNELYLYLMNYLTGNFCSPKEGYSTRTHVVYRGINFIVNMFEHSGKRNTQALTFEEVRKTYQGRERGTFVMFIDSDMILHRDCVLEFLSAMEKDKNLVGMTGYISAMYFHYLNVALLESSIHTCIFKIQNMQLDKYLHVHLKLLLVE